MTRITPLLLVFVLAMRGAIRASHGAPARSRARALVAVRTGAAARRRRPVAPAWLATGLDAAACSWQPDHVWLAWLLGLPACVVLAGAVGGPPLAAIAGVLGAAVPAAVLRAFQERGARMLDRSLPDGLDAIARALRSGASLHQAIAAAGSDVSEPRLASDLVGIAAVTDLGQPLAASLEQWATRRGTSTVRLAVAALSLGAEAGGVQAQAIDGVAATLRDDRAIEREVDALSSQAKLSALVIGLAPLVFGAFAVSTDGRTAAFLLRSPAGLLCLGGGVALDVIAAMWMARLTGVLR